MQANTTIQGVKSYNSSRTDRTNKTLIISNFYLQIDKIK